ncbi:ER-golgi trafficking TRAPP I complex 85 kDa subunit-domain-containing protein [Lipomyces chichibuensis]|uniref:ER-golgi trafficking TRAPP I complex 85 kDa subunit-domain-containing protein n=1 Tax=Lipomyces chichibuensis TaxID=1546026 RepID=UPI00334400D3
MASIPTSSSEPSVPDSEYTGLDRSRILAHPQSTTDTPTSPSPAPSLSASLSSFLIGHPAGLSGSPASPSNAVSPSHLSAIASLVAQSFAPRVSIFASNDANEFARDKGFASVLDLFRPFGDVVPGPVVVRDTQGISTTLDDFGIRFTSSSLFPSTQTSHQQSPTKLRKEPAAPCFDLQDLDTLLDIYLDKGMRYFATELNAPPTALHDDLYYKFLQRLLASPPVSAHESFSHPVAGIIAISSRNPQPIETLSSLYKAGNDAAVPSYMSKDYLRYYVLVHDEDHSDLERSIALFERMKRHFGIHCHMVRLRSIKADLSSSEPIALLPPSQWISAAEEIELLKASPEKAERYIFESDMQNMRSFAHELVVKSLVPFMERCVATWNDQIAASRRGLTGRFFSASRRLLGSNNRGLGSGAAHGAASGNYDPITGSYGFMTAESQMRKLADYAFMLRDWKLAHSTYDLLRKDFLNDKAWKYHAGSQEMAAASLILSGTPLSSKTRADTLEPLLDSATYSYISRCSQPTYALRTILISSELLRSRGGGAADDAARWLMKAISEKLMGNLAHALIIERVSACYSIRKGVGSQGWGNRRRKAAFWQLVAAKEWVSLDKKQHARLCLDEAGENVYDALDWTDEPGQLLFELRHSTESMVYDSSVS